MKKKIKIAFIIAIAVFLVMFTIRIIWGYVKYPHGYNQSLLQGHGSNYLANFNLNRKNIATLKTKGQNIPNQASLAEQGNLGKYEKIGSIVSRSKNFNSDEQAITKIIKQNKAIIQFEQKTGLAAEKNRILKLGIGVSPEKFEIMIQGLKQIARPVSIKIVKTEKTNEYRELQAKRNALLKSKLALAKYRGVGNKVAELISLENRILAIENEIQSFGVKLGDFDNEHEFVTIKLALVEQTLEQAIPFLQRFVVALEWTIRNYIGLATALLFVTAIIFFVILSLFLVTLLIEKFKVVTFNPIKFEFNKKDNGK